MTHDKILAEQIGFKQKCGYWEVNNRYFFDKFECLKYATATSSNDVKYHFYDSVYQSLDWSKEPTLSLNEMYKERAQQLRDKYNYLILSFSGGADSTNILRAFIDNNIKLDEVYCEYPVPILEKLKGNITSKSNSSDLVLFEWYTAANPALKQLSETNPEIKITLHSIIEESIDMVENGELHKHKRGGSINPLIRFHRLYEIACERSKFGTVACINGLDKPRITFNPKTEKYTSLFSDFSNAFSEFSTYAFSEYQISIEQFYNTYDYPQINQKMAFAIKNSLINVDRTSNFYKSLLSHIRNDGVHVYDVHSNYFKQALYSKWNTNIWQAKKSENIFYSPLTKWFFNKEITSNRTRDFYDKQLKELLYGIDHRFIIFNNNTPISLMHYVTSGSNF